MVVCVHSDSPPKTMFIVNSSCTRLVSQKVRLPVIPYCWGKSKKKNAFDHFPIFEGANITEQHFSESVSNILGGLGPTAGADHDNHQHICATISAPRLLHQSNGRLGFFLPLLCVCVSAGDSSGQFHGQTEEWTVGKEKEKSGLSPWNRGDEQGLYKWDQDY